MTIDLKWALPFVLPFLLLLMTRLLAVVAGAPWTPEGATVAVVLCMALGVIIGGFIAGCMQDYGVKWQIHLFCKGDRA